MKKNLLFAVLALSLSSQSLARTEGIVRHGTQYDDLPRSGPIYPPSPYPDLPRHPAPHWEVTESFHAFSYQMDQIVQRARLGTREFGHPLYRSIERRARNLSYQSRQNAKMLNHGNWSEVFRGFGYFKAQYQRLRSDLMRLRWRSQTLERHMSQAHFHYLQIARFFAHGGPDHNFPYPPPHGPGYGDRITSP